MTQNFTLYHNRKWPTQTFGKTTTHCISFHIIKKLSFICCLLLLLGPNSDFRQAETNHCGGTLFWQQKKKITIHTYRQINGIWPVLVKMQLQCHRKKIKEGGYILLGILFFPSFWTSNFHTCTFPIFSLSNWERIELLDDLSSWCLFIPVDSSSVTLKSEQQHWKPQSLPWLEMQRTLSSLSEISFWNYPERFNNEVISSLMTINFLKIWFKSYYFELFLKQES